MKHLLVLPLLLVAACGGGLDTHEGVIDAQIEAMNDITGVLKGVKDAKDAEAAKPKLEKLSKRLKEIQDAGEKLKGEPDPSLMEKKGQAFSTAMSNMMSAAMALPPEAHQILDSIDLR
ncbi:MAG TPA: hypothetical protein VFY93_06865 [Planctomycetota bacterium]|nr:hypothetical protein [Planctomycetota bacterium]